MRERASTSERFNLQNYFSLSVVHFVLKANLRYVLLFLAGQIDMSVYSCSGRDKNFMLSRLWQNIFV